MSELTDDQLDGLFRKSAEEFDPPLDPAAWPDMKARLDKHDGNPSGGLLPVWTNLLRWGLPVVLLLLLTSGGWYAYTRLIPSESVAKPNVSPTKAVSQVAQPQTAKKPKRGTDQLAAIEPIRANVADSPETSISVDKQPAILPESTTANRMSDERLTNSISRVKEPIFPVTEAATNRREPTYKNKTEVNRTTTSGFTTPASVVNERITGKRRIERLGVSSLPAQKQNRISRKGKKRAYTEMGYLLPSVARNSKVPVNQELGQMVRSESTGNLPLPAVKQTEFVLIPALTELRVRPARWPALSPLANRPVIAQPDTVARRVVPKIDPIRGLSVRFVVAPDLSTIGLKNFSRPGTNVGLLLEYRLASRWSVQAGVIQSTKVYRALGNEYQIPSGWWTGTMKVPESVDGKCNMFDIPVNIRYDVLLRNRADRQLVDRWFITGGITSYIMKQEDYQYNYPPHTYGQMSEWSTNSGSYGFSNLNFSAGYERALSRRLSWQVEPFIKAPLKGVGYFKTNLLSTGVFFSIRYKL